VASQLINAGDIVFICNISILRPATWTEVGVFLGKILHLRDKFSTYFNCIGETSGTSKRSLLQPSSLTVTAISLSWW